MGIETGRSKELELLMGKFILSYRNDYFSMFTVLWDQLKWCKKMGVGNIICTKLVDELEGDIFTKIIVIMDKNYNQWLMIYTGTIIENKEVKEELHVRKLYSDHASHVDNNGFIMNYVDKYNIAHKDCIYGNIIGEEYVISYKRNIHKDLDLHCANENCLNLYYIYNEFVAFTTILNILSLEIEAVFGAQFESTSIKSIKDIRIDKWA